MGAIRHGLVIASDNVNPTTERLGILLSCEVKSGIFDAEDKYVLRWGSLYPVKRMKKRLNSVTAIRRTRKKLEMLELLRSAGVIVPKETNSIPCVARWNKGSRGTGLQFCKTEKDMLEAKANGAGAFLEWINIKKEYRIHVFRGLLISICEKKKTRKAHKNIRSASHGWEFCEDAKLHTVDAVSLISAALAAVQALKLDFGAVDIAMNKNNIPVVFEVNTAPGLNEKRAKLYAKAINKWLDTTY